MTVQEAIDLLKQLSPDERRAVLRAFNDDVERPDETGRAALRKWLDEAGSSECDYDDVSSDKYKHLAEIYATEP